MDDGWMALDLDEDDEIPVIVEMVCEQEEGGTVAPVASDAPAPIALAQENDAAGGRLPVSEEEDERGERPPHLSEAGELPASNTARATTPRGHQGEPSKGRQPSATAAPVAVDGRWAWVWRVAFAVLMLLLIAASLHEIAATWVWGHNGYNGAAFSHAARNTLRFAEIGQIQYWAGPDQPPRNILYTHHPLLLHLHVAALYPFFGEHEWVGRLVPAIYTVLSGLMLFGMVRRFWGVPQATAALLVFSLQPIVLIYANMIDHEQGGIFYCLGMVYFYIRWFEQRRLRDAAMLVLMTTLGAQFDWPPYYLAFFLACHAAMAGIRRHRSGFRWTSEYTFVVLYSVIVLINFVGFFAWIYSVAGSFHDMTASFLQRSGAVLSFFSSIKRGMPLMFLIPSVVLAFTWVAVFLVRLGRGEGRLRDLLPVSFLLMQLIHHATFKNAASLHIYWFYYAAPFIGVAGGVMLHDLIVLAWRASRLLLQRWPRAALHGSRALALALVLGFTIPSVAYAYKGLISARAQGSAPGSHYGYTHYDKTRVAAWLNERTRPDEAIWFHPSFDFRVETLWYLDRPHAHNPRIPNKAKVRDFDVVYYVADISKAKLPELETLFKRGHPATLLDGRFLLIDLRETTHSIDGYTLHELEAACWHHFLVSHSQPPTEWVPDPDAELIVRERLGLEVEPTPAAKEAPPPKPPAEPSPKPGQHKAEQGTP
jgi:hypothetical protein